MRAKRSDFVGEGGTTSHHEHEHHSRQVEYWRKQYEQMDRQNAILAEIVAQLQVIVDKMGPREPPPIV